MDAPVLVLEAQLRTLSAAVERLTVARRDLVPAPATFWRGRARDAYDRCLRDLDDRLGSAIEATLLAQRNTVLAIADELRHA
jgi:hypothetical protein